MLPHENLNLGTLRSLLGSCLDQNATRIAPPIAAVAIEKRLNRAARNDRYSRRPC